VAVADVILAILGRQQTVHAVLDAARCLAGLAVRASIIVLAVDTPVPRRPLAAEALMAEIEDARTLRPRDRCRIASLKDSFEAWAAGARHDGITVQWAEEAGSAGVEQRERRADYIVIARPARDDDTTTWHEFRAALFESDRPVLVVPPGPSRPFGRSVAIAWRDDSRSAKAVIPALRVLGAADHVHLIAGVRKTAAEPGIPELLHDHGISATLHILPIGQDVFGKALLAKLHELGADMLVMGAYAHSPLREMIFGGVTRYMCDHADVPVLMRH
jgi:nucleotide-binding universal stress UspA family protein